MFDMAQWEHQACGSLCEGEAQGHPASCWYCDSLLVRVGRQVPGWRRMNRELVTPVQLPAKQRGWECQNCEQVYHQKRCPVHCSNCRHRLNYVPRWREIRATSDRRVIADRRRKRSGVVTPSRRELVYARDDWTCVRCGEDDRSLLTLDHIVPKSKGGDNSEKNLQTLCRRCNRIKADLVPPPGQTWPAELAA